MTLESNAAAMEAPRNIEKSIGQVEICIHQARSLCNICIYQNQDVYAKIFLIEKPESKISTNVVDGGGQNPVFNESFKLDIQTMDSSLRCEVWMLSRIKNYLEDQLLGFLSLPLSDVVSESGKPAREFQLSSSEVFPSPAGFIKLSFEYDGMMMQMPRPQADVVQGQVTTTSSTCDLDKIEFPDEVLVNELERMALEYLCYPGGDDEDVARVSPGKDSASCPVETKSVDDDASSEEDDEALSRRNACVEVKERAVKEEIVDMYMKSMQEFNDALEKMKLPADESGSSKQEETALDEKAKASRVYYGSRAFF